MSDEFKIGDEFEARVRLVSPTTIPGKFGSDPLPAWYVRGPDNMAYVVCESSLRAARRVSTVEETTRIGSIRTDYGTADIPEGARWAGGWSSAGLPVRYEDGRRRTIPWTLPAQYPGPKLARYSASPTPMLLRDTVLSFEENFANVEEGDSAIARDGQPFIEISSGGLRLEGQSMDVWCTTKQAAVRLWYQAVIDYANERGGTTLIWRRKPEMSGENGRGAPLMVDTFDVEHQGPRARSLYCVYSRLHIPKA